MAEDAVRAAFAAQAEFCARLGSPFTARLCAALGERLDRSTAIGTRVLDWTGDPRATADNVPLRLAGGLHFLVRAGRAPPLARLYPPREEQGGLWAATAPLLEAEADMLGHFLDNAPQTNEVGRSAVLMAGLLEIACQFPLPLRLYELGASAGLNLALDRYGYDLGGLPAGEADSPVQLRPRWEGPPPPDAPVRIEARAGIDLRPADPRRDGPVLLAYIWPDQQERLARTTAALAIAAADPPSVDRGDAADWLERSLGKDRAGATRVVFHSIAFQYFPAATQRRIAAHLDRIGAAADEAAPLAWLRYEHVPGDERPSLRLRTWPGGERLLAWAHPHGSRVRWLTGS